MPTRNNPPLEGDEEKEYYDKSEAALRTMSKYDHPNHNAPQYQPGGNDNDSCLDKILSFLFLAITITSYLS